MASASTEANDSASAVVRWTSSTRTGVLPTNPGQRPSLVQNQRWVSTYWACCSALADFRSAARRNHLGLTVVMQSAGWATRVTQLCIGLPVGGGDRTTVRPT